jgi:hypothetical protein
LRNIEIVATRSMSQVIKTSDVRSIPEIRARHSDWHAAARLPVRDDASSPHEEFFGATRARIAQREPAESSRAVEQTRRADLTPMPPREQGASGAASS